MNAKFLDDFNKEYAPISGGNSNDLSGIPDGDYDCTILTANFVETKKTSETLIRMEVRFDSLGKVAEKVYFLRTPENVSRFGGDMATLGISVNGHGPAEWGDKLPLSIAVPAALLLLPSKRFKATKKMTKSKDNPPKEYHNLYINSILNGEAPAPVNYAKADQVPF